MHRYIQNVESGMRGGIAGFFLGATNGREAAETTLGTEFSDHEWTEFGQNCNNGWDRILL